MNITQEGEEIHKTKLKNKQSVLDILKEESLNFGELQNKLPNIQPFTLRSCLALLQEEDIIEKEGFKYYVI